MIAIDPYRSLSAEKCTQHVALLPGTDGALALGMMHVLIGDGLIDRDYIERHTLGYEPLARRVAEYPPERVAKLCGLQTAEVVELARDYGTIKPAAIRLTYWATRPRSPPAPGWPSPPSWTSTPAPPGSRSATSRSKTSRTGI